MSTNGSATEPSQAKLVARWTQEQIGLRALAIFDDANLSFAAPALHVPTSCLPEERLHPTAHSLHVEAGDFTGLHIVGGLDISTGKDGNTAIASLAVLSFPDLTLLDVAHREVFIRQPYIPSYLAMRESQPLVDLIQEYQASHPPESFPQVFLVDGNGRLHDREAGLATAVGVLADVPTIGVAKEYYPLVEGRDGIEKPAVQPDNFRSSQKGFREVCRKLLLKQGDWTSILDAKGEQTLGAAILASKDIKSTRPIYVSSGHRVGLATALQLALACTQTGRVPEPIRQADKTSRARITSMAV